MYSLHAVIEVKNSSLLLLILAKKNRGTPETLYSVVSVYYRSIFNETITYLKITENRNDDQCSC